MPGSSRKRTDIESQRRSAWSHVLLGLRWPQERRKADEYMAIQQAALLNPLNPMIFPEAQRSEEDRLEKEFDKWEPKTSAKALR